MVDPASIDDDPLPDPWTSDLTLVSWCGRVVFGDGWQRRMSEILAVPESTMYRLATQAALYERDREIRPPRPLTAEQRARFVEWLRAIRPQLVREFERRVRVTSYVEGVFESRRRGDG